MSRSRRNRSRSEAVVESDESSQPGERSSIWLAVAVGLFLTRLFLPAESASSGATCVLVGIWLFLAAALSYADWRSGRRWTFQFGDLAIVLVTGPVIAAGLWSKLLPIDQRAAENLLLEWIGLAVSLLVLRRLIDQPGGRRVIAAGFVSVVVGIAGYGIWQHYVWYPQMSAQFTEFEELEAVTSPTADQVARLRELRNSLGPQFVSGDQTARSMLRNRLISSTEPLGFFALANTLAGVLGVAAVVVALSIRLEDRREAILRGLFLGLIVFALLLTKSRTAYLSLLCGVGVCLALTYGRRLPWKSIGLGGGSVVVLIGLLIVTGGLDLEVLTESSKSLAYRVEYWTATLSVIGDHWLGGVGLGNFRAAYLEYKLAGASEEILDPHNWFLEAWTTAGIVGALVSVVLLPGIVVRNSRATLEQEQGDTDVAGRPLLPILIATGLALTWTGFPVVVDEAVLCVGIVALLVAAFGRWTWTDQRLQVAGVAAATVLMVHLLASGGYGMPAIMQLWLVMLVLLAPSDSAKAVTLRSLEISGRRFHVVQGLLVGCLLWAIAAVVQPNLGRERWMATAEADRYLDGDALKAMRSLKNATEADALSPEPWIQLAMSWAQQGDASETQQAVAEALSRSPDSPTLQQWAGTVMRRVGEDEKASMYLRSAVDGYPNGSDVRADLAEVLSELDDPAAASEATLAIALDDLNVTAGHSDKAFPPDRRQRLETIAQEAD